ncbi:PREDICTED: glucan endo-1,3-beta-D-glucosidase-like [Prunus mume]|uniref:Glucan endo-1,3-beta-D-glucosidase-like n=1 Tax=Prunus mume TaxID=102107 RepID=A0ABM0NJ59_PRUMU|nr:PREDICTED: glucan endo-1,3-beta-D-glucosidase-like [Prunus mume]
MAKLALPGPVISLLLLFFFSGGSGPPLPQEKEDTWCVPKPGTPDSALQNIINFTCGILKECSEIQEHGSCYFPNTLINHASFDMNLSYKTDGRYNCDFNGVGLIVVTNPSFGDCIYV